MGRRRRGKCARRNRAAAAPEPERLVRAPHSFVVRRGLCSKDLRLLTKDIRNIMEPFTATHLKERRRNSLKDFVSVSGALHVSHLVCVSESAAGAWLRACVLPSGPTLSFRAHAYTLARDVLAAQRKPHCSAAAYSQPPLLVLDGFGARASPAGESESEGEAHATRLVAHTLQHMFPSINVSRVRVGEVRRVLLVRREARGGAGAGAGVLHVRHYAVSRRPAPGSVRAATARLLGPRALPPDLSACASYTHYYATDRQEQGAEAPGPGAADEEGEGAEVAVAAAGAPGAAGAGRCSVRLHELGPRLTLSLHKVEGGVCGGEVLYHALRTLAPSARAELAARHRRRKEEAARRRAEQLRRVRLKRHTEGGADGEGEGGGAGGQGGGAGKRARRQGGEDGAASKRARRQGGGAGGEGGAASKRARRQGGGAGGEGGGQAGARATLMRTRVNRRKK